MTKHNATWWAERVSELDTTGDADGVARRAGVTVKHLRWWKWRLEAERKKASATTRGRKAVFSTEPRLLPVRVEGVGGPSVSAASDDRAAPKAVVETSRGRLSIRGPISTEQLVAIVAELARAC